ncbi:MAG: hypothetical protein RL063_597 [Pseudomonadota bacterium]|jgi:hypothetical protein
MQLLWLTLLIALLNACASEQSVPSQNAPTTPPVNTYKAPKLPGQCVGISKSNVDEMKRLQLQGRRYMHYCIICNDKKADNPRIIPTVTYTRYDDTTWTFNFGDGYPIDAADTYVELKANQFPNLSRLIGCPAANINNELVIKGKKK